MSELPVDIDADDDNDVTGVDLASKTWTAGQDPIHSHPVHSKDICLAIISGGHTIGKSDANEDSYFLT